MSIPTQITHITRGSSALLVGIPIDNLSLNDAVVRISKMIDEYKVDKRPKYVATVNVDFVIKTMSIVPHQTRDKELLNILRKADLVTADGAPLVLLSKLINQSLQQRVTGADLVPALIEKLARQRQGIYFLGGDGDTASKAIEVLGTNYPGIKITGSNSPFIHTSGGGIIDAEVTDKALIEKINSAKPHVLLLALGNPKQEIWFERNRYKLNVPVCIGIGGTLSFIAGEVKRAPDWMQFAGLEWIYRIVQEPKRLWKRYAEGLIKIGLMSLPSLALSFTTREQIFATSPNVTFRKIQSTTGRSIHLVCLPRDIQESDILLATNFCEYHKDELTLIDFSGVKSIDPKALAILTRLLSILHGAQKRNYIFGISPRLKISLTLNRVFNGIDKSCWNYSLSEILTTKTILTKELEIWRISDFSKNHLEIYPQGDLINSTLKDDVFEFNTQTKIFKSIEIDLQGITILDNAALVYLLGAIRKYGKNKVKLIDSRDKFRKLNILCETIDENYTQRKLKDLALENSHVSTQFSPAQKLNLSHMFHIKTLGGYYD